MSTPPAWHPDPAGSGRLRWWDGEQWTESYETPLAEGAVAPVQTTPIVVEEPVDPSTIWHAVGKPISHVGAGRYRLTDKFLFFEKGSLSMRAQQIPIHEVYDVDARQALSQKARGVGTIVISVHRSSGVEVVQIDDIPNFREGVTAINTAAQAERERLQVLASTQTFQHQGAPGFSGAQSPGPLAAAVDDPVQLLERLGKLRDAGVLTPEEFDAKKADILSRL